MISFKQFITEAEQTPEDVADIIKRECGPYLNALEGVPPYTWLKRGLAGITHRSFFKLTTRKNRRPVDMQPHIHEVLDEYLLDRHGVKFRSDAIFAVSDELSASYYGDYVYVVFPVGDFKYCWSTEIEDAYAFFDGGAAGTDPTGLATMEKVLRKTLETPDPFDPISMVPGYIDYLREFLYKADPYTTKGLSNVTGDVHYKKNEVMIACHSAYYLKYSSSEAKRKADPDLAFGAEVLELLNSK